MSYLPDFTGPDHVELAQTRAERDAATETLARVASLLPDDELRMAEGDTRDLRARIAELEGKLADRTDRFWAVIRWACGEAPSPDGDWFPERPMGAGAYYWRARLRELADSAFLDTDPSAQALTRLVEAAKTLHRHRNWKPRFEGDVPDPPGVLSMAINGVVDAYDALLAARSGRGEGE